MHWKGHSEPGSQSLEHGTEIKAPVRNINYVLTFWRETMASWEAGLCGVEVVVTRASLDSGLRGPHLPLPAPPPLPLSIKVTALVTQRKYWLVVKVIGHPTRRHYNS